MPPVIIFKECELPFYVMLVFFRGLLMPKIIVEDFGGKRSDAGMLGSGIYFASSARLECSFLCCLFYQMIKE